MHTLKVGNAHWVMNKILNKKRGLKVGGVRDMGANLRGVKERNWGHKGSEYTVLS